MSKANNTKANAINAMVQTLSQAKRETAKPSKAVLVLTADEQIKLCTEAGSSAKVMLSARDTFIEAANKLRQAGAVIGDARKCKLAQAFIAARFADKQVAASSKANALAAFRKAIETGKAYDENAKRAEKAAAKKGAQTAPKEKDETESDEAASYSVSIARKGSAKKAAQVLRDLLNKMKSSEEYLPLASLIIDAIDEFDGTAE